MFVMSDVLWTLWKLLLSYNLYFHVAQYSMVQRTTPSIVTFLFRRIGVNETFLVSPTPSAMSLTSLGHQDGRKRRRIWRSNFFLICSCHHACSFLFLKANDKDLDSLQASRCCHCRLSWAQHESSDLLRAKVKISNIKNNQWKLYYTIKQYSSIW